MVIFDCNGVLVDSEPLATAIVSQEFMRAGFPLTPDVVARYFTGRRPADMFAEVEIAAGRKLPPNFAATVASATLRRFRTELRATQHVAMRCPGCAGRNAWRRRRRIDRIRVSLESTDLIRFFEPNLFSASDVPQRQAGARSVPARRRQDAREAQQTASSSRIRPSASPPVSPPA